MARHPLRHNSDEKVSFSLLKIFTPHFECFDHPSLMKIHDRNSLQKMKNKDLFEILLNTENLHSSEPDVKKILGFLQPIVVHGYPQPTK